MSHRVGRDSEGKPVQHAHVAVWKARIAKSTEFVPSAQTPANPSHIVVTDDINTGDNQETARVSAAQRLQQQYLQEYGISSDEAVSEHQVDQPPSKSQISYAAVAQTNLPPQADEAQNEWESSDDVFIDEVGDMLCAHYCFEGSCPYEEQCLATHGGFCEFCLNNCITDRNREAHTAFCIEDLKEQGDKQEMIDRSKKMECAVCLNIVHEDGDITQRRYASYCRSIIHNVLVVLCIYLLARCIDR
jgi:hypothetical protein